MKSIMTDASVLRDVNGYPFIPGTSLAGVLRHLLESQELSNTLMGWQAPDGGEGSRLIVSDAKMLDSKGQVVDGLAPDCGDDPVLTSYRNLPIRQHVRIGQRGATEQRGKYDEEVVLRGTRLCFEMELLATEDQEEDAFLKLIDLIGSTSFRLGGGSRRGFGSVKIVSAQYRKLDLCDSTELSLYLAKSASLQQAWEGFTDDTDYTPKAVENLASDFYQIELTPVDFLMFGSGFGDCDADKVYVSERQVVWKDGKGTISEASKTLFIPSSSIKGALAHRTAFHYNKMCGVYVDQLPEGKSISDYTGQYNAAVSLLFGGMGDGQGGKMRRGNLLFTDIFKERSQETEDHTFNHVKIDRFTGGSVAGALFSEKALYANNEKIVLEIIVDKSRLGEVDGSEKAIKAFECALKDLCSGMLALGGNVTKGNGRCYGSINKNGEKIYEYHRD